MTATDDLFTAVRANDLAGVQAAIAAAADVDAHDALNRNETPLIAATLTNAQIGIVNALLAANADTMLVDVEMWTPLDWSLVLGRTAISAALIADNGTTFAAQNSDGNTVLHMAASVGDTTSMTAIANAGGVIEAMNNKGETPLMFAALNGQTAAVTELLSRGANPRHTNNFGLSAQDFARSSGFDALAVKLQGVPRKTISTNYTITTDDSSVLIGVLTAAISITLPQSSAAGSKTYNIMDVGGSVQTHSVTIQTSGLDYIGGTGTATSFPLNINGMSLSFISDGVGRWLIE